MHADLKELEDGLIAVTDYDGGMREKEATELAELQRSLTLITPELDRLNIEHETHLKATKRRFNVFTVLRGAGEEPGLHTRWLAFLLNPKEHHDCGDLFLKLFLARLAKGVQKHNGDPILQPELDKPAGLQDATVERERRIDEGQLDLLISLPGWGDIVIENKINAHEQERQLERYGKFLYGRNNIQHSLLLYLTLDGVPSQTAGTYTYYRISFRDHILDWLNDCLCATYQYVNINQALQQYRDVVYQNTVGLPMEKEYMTTVVNLIEKYPAIIKYYRELGPAIEELRKMKQRDFWEEVNKHLKQEDIVVGEWGHRDDSGGYDLWPILIAGVNPPRDNIRLWIFFERKTDFFICAWPQKIADDLDPGLTDKIRNALPGLKSGCQFSNSRAAVELPEVFTEQELGCIVAHPDVFINRARESAEIIRQYVRAIGIICPGLIPKRQEK